MTSARPHYKLAAWKEAISLVKLVYEATARFPKEEMYGLTAQIRRAAVSIPSNLAEGAARTSQREFAQFLSVAKGSLSELETQLIVAVELGFLKPEHASFNSLEQVSKLFSGLHRRLVK